jgi:outer membrane immunogenic protein
MRLHAALATLSLAALLPVNAARAADMLPPVPPLEDAGHQDFSWEGLYGGIHAGYGTADFKAGDTATELASQAYYASIAQDLATTIAYLPNNLSDQQPLVGAFVGYNRMFDDAMVGVELEYNHFWNSLEGSASNSDARRRDRGTATDQVSYTASTSAELGDYLNLKFRGGWAVGNFMPYAFIGAVVAKQRVVGDYQSTYQENVLNGNGTIGAIISGPNAHNARYNKTGYNWGLSLGAGIDVALADNLMLRAEYQYVGMSQFRGVSTTAHTGRIGIGFKY